MAALGSACTPERQKPLLARIDPDVVRHVMPPAPGAVTMMFTDIVDSTAINAAMGDDRYLRDVLEPHNRLVRERVATHDGRELKTTGDACLVGFASPRGAVECGKELSTSWPGT